VIKVQAAAACVVVCRSWDGGLSAFFAFRLRDEHDSLMAPATTTTQLVIAEQANFHFIGVFLLVAPSGTYASLVIYREAC
jgi:hypothetical protein